jgi:hypothetical protein
MRGDARSLAEFAAAAGDVLDDEGLVVVVRDDRVGFLPRNDSPGAGLGIPTIAALVSALSLTTPAGGGTEVRMVFALDALG